MIIDEKVHLDLEIEGFLEHHGIKGQKWGTRNKFTSRRVPRMQKRLDAIARVSTGQGSNKDHRTAINVLGSTFNKKKREKRAKRVLVNSANAQNKIKDGKLKAFDILTKLKGVNYRDLNFHQND